MQFARCLLRSTNSYDLASLFCQKVDSPVDSVSEHWYDVDMTEKQPLGLRLPKNLVTAVKVKAAQEGRTVSELVRNILEPHFFPNAKHQTPKAA